MKSINFIRCQRALAIIQKLKKKLGSNDHDGIVTFTDELPMFLQIYRSKESLVVTSLIKNTQKFIDSKAIMPEIKSKIN